MTEPTVTVGICTYRRAHLVETLRSLAAIEIPPGITVAIVVADNDAEPSAAALVDSVRGELPFPIDYRHVPAANISLARNGCLDHASGRYLAFLDDDEIVTRRWLSELLAKAGASGAAAVLGPVEATYRADAPSWMKEGDFHSTYPVFVDGAIVTGYTCNVLLDRHSPAVEGLRFDPARGRSGGEDTAFFSEIHARGGRIDYAPEAWVHEEVPGERARFGWLARRRFRMGQTHGQLIGLGRALPGRSVQMAVAGAKLGACALMSLTALSAVPRRRNLLRGILHAGTIGGLLGMRGLVQYGGASPSREGTARAA